MSQGARALIGAAAVVAAVVLFVVLQDSGSDDDSDSTESVATSTTTETTADEGGHGQQKPDKPEKPEEPEIPTIVIKNGQPVGGVAELEFDQGDEIAFKVQSDVTDHIHLHTYDVMKDVTAGDTVTMRVPATLEGVHEVELEDSVVPIAEITVNPG